MFEKVLIANRGEIALRIYRACREMGIGTVAVHSTEDQHAMHVRLADEAVCIGPAASAESYLNIPAILSAATVTNTDAIHPGVGFLSENENFATMVEEHGFTFIGPSADHIRLMGDKITAKDAMKERGVPVVPGSDEAISTFEEAKKIAAETGYPLLIKASGGGGGRGMQIVEDESRLEEALNIAQREAEMFFGNKEVFIEKYLLNPRHIEIQILADGQGGVIHLGERDCSIQRRHQKLIEEAPSPALNAEMREKIGTLCVNAVRDLGYKGAGTLEFLYSNGEFFFIEMNTRIQVEHPVSEMITGVDLIREQIRIASGSKLSITQDDIVFNGHAIECRINAENPRTFMPSPGTIGDYHIPGGLGVRVDSALYAGYKIPSHYDSLVSKLIVHGKTRNECIMRLNRALKEYVISGIETTIPLQSDVINHADFLNGHYNVHWLEAYLKSLEEAESNLEDSAA